jgi:IclR family transcriptional regulator, acetate operon repressor
MKSVQSSGSQQVESLGRVLDVLELFSAERLELSLTEVADRLGWPTPTAHRVVSTLVAREFLTRDPTSKRLRLGASVLRLAAPLMATMGLPEVAQPHMDRLAMEMGETVNLAVLDGADIMYIASASGSFLLRAETPPGLRLPAHCTALGKSMLAQLDQDAARERLGKPPYPARTSKSVRSWKQLAPQLKAARELGYAVSLEEYEVGLNSCAVSVPTRNGVTAAINVAALASRVSAEDLVRKFVPKLRTTAELIARGGSIDDQES